MILCAVAVGGCSGSSPAKPKVAAGVTPVAGQRTFPTALATVAPSPVASAAGPATPIPISATGTFGGRVTVTVTKTASVVSTATGPGQVTGAPAVAVTFSIRNGSGRPVALDTVDVTATYGTAATPASPVLGDQTSPLHGSLKNGSSATGVYTFEIPTKQRDEVRLTITYTSGQPSVVFSGTIR